MKRHIVGIRQNRMIGAWLACALVATGCSAGAGTDQPGVADESLGSAAAAFDSGVAHKDFNRDGQYDLLFRNWNTGEMQAWFMSGTDRVGFNYIREQSTQTIHHVNYPWYMRTTSDMDLDGSNDLVFQNVDTGEAQIWFMSGTDRIGFESVEESSTNEVLHAGRDWSLLGSGDFNRDGSADLLWSNGATGELQVWFMRGSKRVGFNSIKEQSTQLAHHVTSPWYLRSVADFNLDGNVDLLFQNVTTGVMQVWFMLGTDRIGFNSLKEQSTQVEHHVTAPWRIVDTGLVNNDSSVDILFYNDQTGEMQVWFMSGTDRIGFNSVKEQSTQAVHHVTYPWTPIAQ